MSDGESDLSNLFSSLKVKENETNKVEMDPAMLQSIVQSAVLAALQAQNEHLDKRFEQMAKSFTESKVKSIVVYEDITINREIKCDESLDVVKCLPEFSGDEKKEIYVSWRKAAHKAFHVFEPFVGSSKYYQALTIIRSKVRGKADSTLTSFDTAHNFDAIIARLDFTYADKRPMYLLEQQLSTLRQGNSTILQYYDEVEKCLTLLTNKTVMSYEPLVAIKFNEKYRQDALRVFISGLKRSLSDTLFAARPASLPAALALAEELEGNRERYQFAAGYQKHIEKDEDKGNKLVSEKPKQEFKNPHFEIKNSLPTRPKSEARIEPMDVDPSSSKFRQSNLFRNSERRRQTVNHLEASESEEKEYEEVAERAVSELELDFDDSDDEINFLG